jgi:carbon monoxide dehydrogenase subunit G
MDVSASYKFAAPQASVWTLLNDPDIVGGCLPGCDRLEPLGDDRYRAELTLAVASVSGQYSGTVTILDNRPPHSYRLVVEGSGKPGFVKGEVVIELVGQPDETTTVHVKGEGQVGGLIARVGQRLLGSVSKMMMDRFFACLQQKAEKSSKVPGF